LKIKKLNIWVSQPLTNNRADGAAFLNQPNLNKSNPDCTYPKSNFIHKEVRKCLDLWHFDIPWTSASKCGWTIIDEEGFKVYKGQVVVHNHEWLAGIQDWRFFTSCFKN